MACDVSPLSFERERTRRESACGCLRSAVVETSLRRMVPFVCEGPRPV